MKNSGIEWIEGLPETWQEIPNRYLFIDHSVKVGEQWKDYQLLSLTTSGVKEKNVNTGGGKVPDSYENYQTVEIGDMIFCLFDLDCSAVFSGLSNYNGMITSAYNVFMPNSKYLNNLYVDYWFQYVFSNRYYKMYSKNIRYTVTTEMFKSILTPIPPLDEQRKIGEFLLEKDKQIAELIANQQVQIEKLKEYKQSVITEAVTKGLDKSAPMKDSGIEWIGEIPAHWDIIATKSLFDVIAGATPDSSNPLNWDGEIRWITPADYKTEDIYVEFGRRNLSKIGFNSCSTSLIPAGNIIFSKRAPIGAVVINNTELCTNQGCLSCVNKGLANIKFYYYTMSIATEQYELLGSGTTFKEISCNTFSNFRLPYPSLEMQQQIADYLDEKCGKIDRLIAIKQEKIEKLQEYKKSLIYEYVTGKKEVV